MLEDHSNHWFDRDDLGYPPVVTPRTFTCGCEITSYEVDTLSFLVENFCRVFSCDEIDCLNHLRQVCLNVDGDAFFICRLYLCSVLHDLSCRCWDCEGECRPSGFFHGEFRGRVRRHNLSDPNGSPTSVLD
ncbi:p15 [Hibiscus-infecting cilevirus]|nr:p15 [Hibiscus-infecting cilevirus]